MSRKKSETKRARGIFRVPPLKTLGLFFLSLGFFSAGIIAIFIVTIRVPDFRSFEERKIVESSKIYDRTGKILLYSIQDTTKRTVVPLDQISRYVKNATVAIEDAEFYQHFGIKPSSIIRAILANITTGSYGQGGSTITQQVVKNALLTKEKTISRKLKEWVLAVKIEKILNKEQILTLYLNEAPYGGNIYGVEEASLAFFGKHASELDLGESAYLAALPQAPTFYSPYGNHKDRLDERKKLVLLRMRELSFITVEEFDKAIAENITFLPQETHGIKAPHFVTWVREYLAEKYGEEALTGLGLKVITTLDYDLQKKAESAVETFGNENEKKFNAKNAGMVGIDPRTGEVLVMVGSRDYFNREAEGNFNIALAHRQPGSAFKPFVYAAAFEKGYTPETVVFDLETEFDTRCDTNGKPLNSATDPKVCDRPGNYDNVFRGPVTLRNALAQSINIPAMKVLYLAGIKDSIETARKMGIEKLAGENQYGLTLVLGSGEVSLLDMTSAYGVFANNGVRNPHQGILRVEDKGGAVLEEFYPRSTEVLSKNVALQISDVLSDNVARTPAFGAQSYLYFPGKDVAVKTGTTNDYKDAWIVGYTPTFSLGAWVGNNDNTPMEKKVAGFIVAPMWNSFMKEVLSDPDYQSVVFEKPVLKYPTTLKPILRGIWKGGEAYTIDRISGKLATEYTPEETKEERILTNVHEILYWVDKNNPLGPRPEHPEGDPQFSLWEKPVREWVARQGIGEQSRDIIPKEVDDVHGPGFSPNITVVYPNDGASLHASGKVFVSINSAGRFPLARADFFVNDIFIGSSNKDPFGFSFIPNEIDGMKPQGNTLRVVGYDSVFNTSSVSVLFGINSD
ncbi:MAG: PBP1A family penicillin-binding protein [bacterium]|nr:PBP1A family penicillin-binding protein [bacterium]